MGFGEHPSRIPFGIRLLFGAVIYYTEKLFCFYDKEPDYIESMAYSRPPSSRLGVGQQAFPPSWQNKSKTFIRPHKRAIRPSAERVTLSASTTIPIAFPNPDITHGPNTLLGLPYELRTLILSYALPPTDVRTRLRAAHFDSELNPGENLLLVCRQLYHELTNSAFTHRCVLITPGPSTALPLGSSRLAKADAEVLARVGVREVLIRDYMSGLTASWWVEQDAKPKLRLPAELGRDTSRVIISACICFNKNNWDQIRSGLKVWRSAFCSSAWSCVHALGWDTAEEVSMRKWSAKKVVIYVCGAPLNTGVFDSMLTRVRIKEMLDYGSIIELFRDDPDTARLTDTGSEDGDFWSEINMPDDMWLTERLRIEPVEREPYDEEKLSGPRLRGGWISEVDEASEPFARYRLRLKEQFLGDDALSANAGVIVEIRDSITECSERCVLHG